MPTRSLSSSVLAWPDRLEVDRAARLWALQEAAKRANLLRLGYFGSYARGDWGVGSDLDLVAVVRESRLPFERRALEWDLNALPVPAELLVYTEAEWAALMERAEGFARALKGETVWIYPVASAAGL
jgi:predicted nucleotidyltransferase